MTVTIHAKHLLAVSAVSAVSASFFLSVVYAVSAVFVIKVGPRHQSCTLPKHTHDSQVASFTTTFDHGDRRRRSALCACRRCLLWTAPISHVNLPMTQLAAACAAAAASPSATRDGSLTAVAARPWWMHLHLCIVLFPLINSLFE